MKKIERYPLEIRINGIWERTEVEADETLLHTLREKLGHHEVKEGCGKGDCGACAVILNGRAANACLILALQANGQEVYTVKGLGTPEKPHPLQEAFIQGGAIQCGFCTAGMLLTAKALLDQNPHPTREEIREAISGNLCRCTGYQKIIDAIDDAATRSPAREEIKRK